MINIRILFSIKSYIIHVLFFFWYALHPFSTTERPNEHAQAKAGKTI